jgi:dTDP-4-amino-4,6-dideoxygalactose transaminase
MGETTVAAARAGTGEAALDGTAAGAQLTTSTDGRSHGAGGGEGVGTGASNGATEDKRTDTVPFVALAREHAAIADELQAAFDRIIRTSAFILGDELELFESDFARSCGTRHCVGVGSGTAALTIALVAAGVGPGDEVIVPAHTFISSALAVVHAGADVVFCDVERASGLLDPSAAAALVGPNTAAIMPVHLYGQCCDMPAIRSLADRHDLLVLEDAAQAHGASSAGKVAGGLGDAATFSFYPSKNLGALGDGGAICTDDVELAERARSLRDVGRAPTGAHVELGFNERLDALQAAMLRVKLPHLAAANAARRRHAERYRGALRDELLLVERPSTPCIYHVFPLLVEDRDAAAASFSQAGIATGVHYRLAASDHPVWDGRATSADVASARHWAAHELSLPMFPALADAELERVLAVCSDLGYTKPSR